MKTIKDILEIPLSDLKENIKEYIDISFNYWEKVLSKPEECSCDGKCETESEEQVVPKLPDDLSAVLELNKAVVEKYQATEADSLLKHLAKQLSNDRSCEPEDVINEIKEAIKLEPEHKKLLTIHKADRAEFLVNNVIEKFPELVEKIIKDGNKEAMKSLEDDLFKSAFDVVSKSDLMLALRSTLQALYLKKNKPNISLNIIL